MHWVYLDFVRLDVPDVGVLSGTGAGLPVPVFAPRFARTGRTNASADKLANVKGELTNVALSDIRW